MELVNEGNNKGKEIRYEHLRISQSLPCNKIKNRDQWESDHSSNSTHPHVLGIGVSKPDPPYQLPVLDPQLPDLSLQGGVLHQHNLQGHKGEVGTVRLICTQTCTYCSVGFGRPQGYVPLICMHAVHTCMLV